VSASASARPRSPRRDVRSPRGPGSTLSLRSRLLLALAYVLLLAIVALEVPLALNLRDRVDREVRSQALSEAEVAAATSAGQLSRPGELRRIATTVARSARGRVVIVDGAGKLIADSAGQDVLGADYSTRPEIAAALRGRTFQEQRRSQTLDAEILATALPVLARGRPEGAVRVTQSVDAVNRATRASILGLIAIGGVVLLLGLAAGALIARQIAGPLRRLDEAAARVSEGDLAARATVEGSEEQRSLATTFNQMTARLERLVAGQREFVADASHQLRTPLSGLRLRLEEARAQSRDPETAEEEIDGALVEVDRLAAMVTELLLLSQAGEADAPAERVDLAAAARRAAGRFDDRVSTVSGAPVPPVQCAPADLDRTLDALIENALHYGGGNVTLVPRPGAVDVLDEGPGIDPAELEHVFERFHRGRAGRAGPPGTGLGLAIARELMRRWGGDVRLANRDGGGTAATVSLPLDGA
jgi:signal transduction histidine kinase